ncbi:hypothetical protein [Paenibacillus roseipurpureus]|uniref:Right handed beta helix domain-containing protein n=1 Tax=Paenibacillus roseopurpureus TaxID=2918901 RepID=A0AA96LLS4_9BACL|nr:hypothetical protein [Paenibacillus sp. MBLB1832]WNR43482.1 hypothetical protein MJB10_20585 [Paenibacillus sp. MBLB1832]
MIYHVSPLGDDLQGNGTAVKPWNSVAYAATQVAAGHTIRIEEGVYREFMSINLGVGVNLVGAGPDKTVLQADFPHAFLIRLISSSNEDGNQRISGFTIDGMNKQLQGGIIVSGVNHVTLHDVDFVRCRMTGSLFTDNYRRLQKRGGEPKRYITGSNIHNCRYINSSGIGDRYVDGTKCGLAGNLMIAGLDGADIHHITIEDLGSPEDENGYGIKFWQDGYLKNVKIHDSFIRVKEYEDYWGANFSVELWNIGPGCEIYNIDCNTTLSLGTLEDAFQAKHTHDCNLKVHDCRVVSERLGGIPQTAVETGASGTEVYNCYFENFCGGVGFWHSHQEVCRNFYIHDNVFVIPESIHGVRNERVQGLHAPWGMFFMLVGNYEHVRVTNNIFKGYGMGIRIGNVGERTVDGFKHRDVVISGNRFIDTQEYLLRIDSNDNDLISTDWYKKCLEQFVVEDNVSNRDVPWTYSSMPEIQARFDQLIMFKNNTIQHDLLASKLP